MDCACTSCKSKSNRQRTRVVSTIVISAHSDSQACTHDCDRSRKYKKAWKWPDNPKPHVPHYLLSTGKLALHTPWFSHAISASDGSNALLRSVTWALETGWSQHSWSERSLHMAPQGEEDNQPESKFEWNGSTRALMQFSMGIAQKPVHLEYMQVSLVEWVFWWLGGFLLSGCLHHRWNSDPTEKKKPK